MNQTPIKPAAQLAAEIREREETRSSQIREFVARSLAAAQTMPIKVPEMTMELRRELAAQGYSVRVLADGYSIAIQPEFQA